MTREEWQSEKDTEQLRTGAWGFDPGMPWDIANWRERIGIVLFHAIGWCVVFPAMFIGALLLLGMMMDGANQRSEDHDRCMKHATNGYEIEKCR
jgi:hypothetical protein